MKRLLVRPRASISLIRTCPWACEVNSNSSDRTYRWLDCGRCHHANLRRIGSSLAFSLRTFISTEFFETTCTRRSRVRGHFGRGHFSALDHELANGTRPWSDCPSARVSVDVRCGTWRVGLMGKSIRAAVVAAIATGFLGAMLAVVFLLSGRRLAPCVVAHFAINLFAEPGLVLAATRGEMAGPR